MSRTAAPPPEVAAALAACAPARRQALLELRTLILEAAEEADVEIVETLKWGQPAYLPVRPRVGTTVRIGELKGSADGYALYVHCQTSLMEQYQHLYPDAFRTEGRRALLFSTDRQPPREALKHCVALALAYHRSARAG